MIIKMVSKRNWLNLLIAGVVGAVGYLTYDKIMDRDDEAVVSPQPKLEKVIGKEMRDDKLFQAPLPKNPACDVKTLEGGLPYEVHVIYEQHHRSSTGESNAQTIASQIQKHRILEELVQKGISAVFVENLNWNETFSSRGKQNKISHLVKGYQLCKQKTSQLAADRDFCLTTFSIYDWSVGDLLLNKTKNVIFVGHSDPFLMERNLAAHKRVGEKWAKNQPHNPDDLMEDIIISHYLRSKDFADKMCRIATWPQYQDPPRIAAEFGQGHAPFVELYLKDIDPAKRPTFFFYDTTKCHDRVRYSLREIGEIKTELEADLRAQGLIR